MNTETPKKSKFDILEEIMINFKMIMKQTMLRHIG